MMVLLSAREAPPPHAARPVRKVARALRRLDEAFARAALPTAEVALLLRWWAWLGDAGACHFR